MRWLQHWTIARDCRRGGFSLAYQLGSILPDYFMRKPIHRIDESMNLVMSICGKLRTMPKGWRRDYYLGIVVHYICDYCTEAHNTEYYRLLRHRIYEVKAQKYFVDMRRSCPHYYSEQKYNPMDEERLQDLSENNSIAIYKYIYKNIKRLRKCVEMLDSKCWFTDNRIMDLNCCYAYRIASTIVCFYKELWEKSR